MQGPPVLGDGLPVRGPPPEVWLEHVSPEGRSYYSNPQTKKTTWDRPANARIIAPPSSSSNVVLKNPPRGIQLVA